MLPLVISFLKLIGVDPSMFCNFYTCSSFFSRCNSRRIILIRLTFHHILTFLLRIRYFQGFSIQFMSRRLGSPSRAVDY